MSHLRTIRDGIEYRVATAGVSGIYDHVASVVTVAQALHWFDLETFSREIRRVSKPGALLAVWSHSLAEICPKVDDVTRRLHEEKLGADWDPERKLVEQGPISP